MSEKTFNFKPWNESTKIVAEDVIGQIRAVAPHLEVLYMGASALGLPGDNDIDLDVLCDKNDLDFNTILLSKVLGTPKEIIRDDITKWEFAYRGLVVDCILSDPKYSHVSRQKKIFEILQSSPEVREAYIRIKQECDRKPYSVYKEKKAKFFDKISNFQA